MGISFKNNYGERYNVDVLELSLGLLVKKKVPPYKVFKGSTFQINFG